MRRLGAIAQPELLSRLKRAIDAAMIAHPTRGTNPAARRTIRSLIRENPESALSFKVAYNLGRQRRAWLGALLREELGDERVLRDWSPWLDDTRANGPLVEGHDTDAEGSAPDAETAKLERP